MYEMVQFFISIKLVHGKCIRRIMHIGLCIYPVAMIRVEYYEHLEVYDGKFKVQPRV